MQSYVNSVIINFFAMVVYVRGEVPGVKSILKCNEYYNASLYARISPLSQEDIEFIQKIEAGYVPANAFIGGYNAKPKQLSFIAALGYGNDTNKEYLCGGSLISQEFVVTAAHCVFARSFGIVKSVRLGDLNLTSSEDDQWVQELEVKEYFVHPEYKPPKKYHDIALLKLDKAAVLNEYVRTICLEPQRTILRYSTLYAAGWGALGYGGNLSSHLQVGDLYYFYVEDCRKVYEKNSFEIPQGIVDDFQVCAGGLHKVSDTCAGDSGGPLFYVNDDQKPRVETLIGITSYGKPCGSLKIPGVYTRVAHYVDWIESVVWPDDN